MESGLDIERLQEFEKTRGKLRLPPDLKPCIAALLNGASPDVKQGTTPFIIACELYRVGRDERQIGIELLNRGVSQSKVRDVVQSVATGRYNFGCPRLEQEGICLEKSRQKCWWYGRIPRKNQKYYREHDFWRFGWPQRLRPAVIVIYWALREVEKRRRYPAGSWLYVSRKKLSEITGISRPWVIECCEKLQEVDLIEFKKGRQHRWYGQASEIRRIIPIPRPKV